MNEQEHNNFLLEKAVKNLDLKQVVKLLDEGADAWVSVAETSKLTGWSNTTVRNAMADNDVEWKIGERARKGIKLVRVSSVKKYIEVKIKD